MVNREGTEQESHSLMHHTRRRTRGDLDEDDYSVEFLLAEYSEINEERRRSRAEGPNRLNFFITIASSVLGGLVLLFQVGTVSQEAFQAISIAALLFLWLVGWDTFLFSISRDIGTDFNIRSMARVRRFFTDRDPSLRPYLSWQEYDTPTPYITRDASSVRSTTQAMLGLFCALIVGLLLNIATHSRSLALGGGSIALGCSVWLLRRYAAKRLHQARTRADATARFRPQKQTSPLPSEGQSSDSP